MATFICSIYPACLAPYLLVTASTDNKIRFWTAVDKSGGRHEDFAWEEWRMETEHGSSAIQVPGCPLSVSAAYTGRIAVAYRSGQSFSRKNQAGSSRAGEEATCYVNLFVAIYECESTGGSEWIREDTIHLKNIELRTATLPPVDLSVYDDHSGVSRLVQHFQDHSKHDRITGELPVLLKGLTRSNGWVKTLRLRGVESSVQQKCEYDANKIVSNRQISSSNV